MVLVGKHGHFQSLIDRLREESRKTRWEMRRAQGTGLPRLVSDIGHIILHVGNMDEALRLYRDILGFDVKEQSPEWTVITTKLGELTLYKTPKIIPLILKDSGESPINLHVAGFQQAAEALEKEGYRVERTGRSSGTLHDPWGNMISLHDHQKH